MNSPESPGQEPPACGHCRYFHEHSGAAGDCHRYPPLYADNDTPNERHRWKHPLVPHNGWCGEFRGRLPNPAPPEEMS